jgi:hypothetical protein
MGKVLEHSNRIDEWSLKQRINYEGTGWFESMYPNPEINQRHYYYITTKVVEWKKFDYSDKIEYRLEKGTKVRLWDKEFTVEDIQVNQDGSVTCFTSHVISENVNHAELEKEARQEVIDLYRELKSADKKVEEKEEKVEDKTETVVEKKGFWKNFFK